MLKSVKKVTKVLIASDFFLNSAFGVLGPIFAIFLLENIQGGNAKVAGFAATVYWLVKSSMQIPIGKYLDKNHGEKDDFYFMIFGNLLTAFVPLGYLLSSKPIHIYFLQALQGVGMAMAIPAWSAIFTRHISRGKEAFEWSLESTTLGFGAGLASAIGGFLAATFGFKIVFVVACGLNIISGALLILIHEEIYSRNITVPHTPPYKTPL